MSKKVPLTHLTVIAAALLALAAGAYWYTASQDPVPGIPEELIDDAAPVAPATPDTEKACEAASGAWNECGSACPDAPPGTACIQMCVPRCEGLGDGKTVVSLHFPNSALDPEHLDCTVVFPVRRAVSVEDGVEAAAVEALLGGPSDKEREAGYFTSFPDDVTLRSVALNEGILRVDFSKELKKVAGSCRVESIRAQVERTLMLLPGVKSVVISVDGKVDEALQP